ncbi:MAG: NUDIX hydrolase [Bacteroidota bacterium]
MSKDNPWKTLSSTLKYENPWMSVTEHKVINPAGNDGVYGVVHFKNNAVAVIPLDEENNTWIVGQYRYTLNSYEWEVPEGGSPEGEDPMATAYRELEEETGLKASSMQLIMQTELSNSVTDEVSYSYVAKGLSYIGSSPEETEQLQIRKLPFDELFEMAMNGEIKDALSVASIFKVKLMMLKGEL